MLDRTTILWRPVGPTELDLVAASGWRRFPPRLPEQPIFYPVCNEVYAREIAERWNAKDRARGFVLRFEVGAEFPLAVRAAHRWIEGPRGVLDPRGGVGGVQRRDRGGDRGGGQVSVREVLTACRCGVRTARPRRPTRSPAGTMPRHKPGRGGSWDSRPTTT